MNPRIAISLAIVLAVAAFGAGFWYRYVQQAELPPSVTEAPTSRVKSLSWNELRTGVEQMKPAEIRDHGVRLFQEGDPDKAFLMFKTAAKRGDGWSALAVGEMYDPATFAAADFSPKRTAFSKPNPYKALQWYKQAMANGETRAQAPHDRLLAELRQAADTGDDTARRVLRRIR